jgi:hypothetical protein
MWRIVMLVGVLVSWPSSAQAWGFDAHKFIADRMIELLPPELKPLFQERRLFIAGAWEAAGKPAIPAEGPRTPRRIRRPTP